MKKKTGFTLIELLAVIVILAIIALIAVTVIMNIMEKSNKSAFKDTAYGILSAGELYFAEQQLDIIGMTEEKVFNLKDKNEDLQLKGEVPAGILKINQLGQTALVTSNNRYCVTKGYNDIDITITENYTTCDNPDINIFNKKNLFVANNIKNSRITVEDNLLSVWIYASNSSTSTNSTLRELCPELVAGKKYIITYESDKEDSYISIGSYTNKNFWLSGKSRKITEADLDSTVRIGTTAGAVSSGKRVNFFNVTVIEA